MSTPDERLWSSTLADLANGKAYLWFHSKSQVLIMVGEALRDKSAKDKSAYNSECSSSEIDNGFQETAKCSPTVGIMLKLI